MDRLGYLGYANDAEVDALLSQLNDESLLRMKVNTHNTSNRGFEYPTFTDAWVDNDPTEALDTQLTSRFSNLKRPIPPAKKNGKDSTRVGKNVFNSDGGLGGKKISNSDRGLSGRKGSEDSQTGAAKNSRDSDVIGSDRGEEGKSGRLSSKSSSRTSSRRREDGSSSRRYPTNTFNRETSRSSSQRSEFLSLRSSEDREAAADDYDEDQDNIDALLNERFRALKGPSYPLPHPAPSAATIRNLSLDNIIQISGQLSPNDYDSYGSAFSTPSSPSANLLGRSKSRSSPRLMTTSVATSCHCSAPSPLKLLKQVGSKSFPSKQQFSPSSLPPLSPAPPSSTNKKVGRPIKMEGFGNSKPADKNSEKNSKDKKVEGFGNCNPADKNSEKTSSKDKRDKKGGNDETNSKNQSTVKEVRRLLSSVADRVGLERSRVSSAVDDEFPGEDLAIWSVMDGEEEFAKASTEEQKLNREAERVVEWAKDAARLGAADPDLESEGDELELDEEDDEQESDQRKPSKKEKPKKMVFKVAPKKKRWGLF